MTILRITARWGGFRGAPGYSNFYFAGQTAVEEDALAHAESVRVFFQAVRDLLPSAVNIQMTGTATNIDETNGKIIGEVPFTPPATVIGSGAANYSAASGAVVNWNTSTFRNGRRVRGRTFLVPLATGAYDNAGDLSAGSLTSLRAAASALIAAPGPSAMVVWARPGTNGAGVAHPVTGASVPDLGAILRSRRD